MFPDRPKRARVYLRHDGKKVIVVAVHFNQDGVLVEADGPLALTTWDDESLGESAKTALEQSSTITRDLRTRKMSDWKTLQVSGEPSLRAFQVSFVQIDLIGVETADTRIDAAPEPELTIQASVPFEASPADYARKITRIYQICRDRRF